MAANGKKSARSDDTLVLLLATGKSQKEAALTSGFSPRHVARKVKDPAFQARVEQARNDLFTEALGQLTRLLQGATITLGRLLDPKTPPAVRLAAARSILDYAGSYRHQFEVVKDIEELKKLLASGGQDLEPLGAKESDKQERKS